MVLAHSDFRPLLRSRACRCFFFGSPGPLRASLCAPCTLLWARIFLKSDVRDCSKLAFLLSVQFWAPSHVPLAPNIPQNAPDAPLVALLSPFPSPAFSPEGHFCTTLSWFWPILTFAPCCVQGPLETPFWPLLAPLGLPLPSLGAFLGALFRQK